MVTMEVGKAEAKGEVKIPEDIALLPFAEKAKLIVALRRQNKSYREIQRLLKVSPRDIKRALKLEAHKDDIEELKAKVGELESKLSKIERILAELQGFKAEVLGVKGWLERGLNRRFRHDLKDENCVYMVGGFCENWVWKEPVEGWSMKKAKYGYILNVDKHRWICALCPSFKQRWFMNWIKEENRLTKETKRILEMILAKR